MKISNACKDNIIVRFAIILINSTASLKLFKTLSVFYQLKPFQLILHRSVLLTHLKGEAMKRSFD